MIFLANYFQFHNSTKPKKYILLRNEKNPACVGSLIFHYHYTNLTNRSRHFQMCYRLLDPYCSVTHSLILFRIAENLGIHLSKCEPNCHNIKCHIWYDSLIYAHIASIVHRFSVFFKGLYYPRMMWNNFISYMNHGSPVYTEKLWKLFLLLFHYFRHPGFSRNKNSAPPLRSTIPVSQQTYPLLLAELLLHSFFRTKILATAFLPWMVKKNYGEFKYIYVMTRLLKDRLCIKMTFMHNDWLVNYYEKCSRHWHICLSINQTHLILLILGFIWSF